MQDVHQEDEESCSEGVAEELDFPRNAWTVPRSRFGHVRDLQ